MLKHYTKSLLLIVVLFIGFYPLKSQELVSAGGGYFESSGGSISYTFGEIAIDYFIEESFMLTQGFQQSTLPITTGDDELSDHGLLSAYPNPTSDFTYIDIEPGEEFKYQLFSFHGELLELGDINSFTSKIDLRFYRPAVYLVRIFENENLLKSIKIIKQ